VKETDTLLKDWGAERKKADKPVPTAIQTTTDVWDHVFAVKTKRIAELEAKNEQIKGLLTPFALEYVIRLGRDDVLYSRPHADVCWYKAAHQALYEDFVEEEKPCAPMR